ncbi:hypothetical protein [Massilia sp. DWR3-1-1]|uniref:hypothetical protein n=1 Tax=Massilia sp. DWR3-1-1 TaxID=2804559 RepID=UPI003CF30FA2
MANTTLKISAKRAWWLKPYCFGVAAMSALTGREPDWDKVKAMIRRGITFKFESTSEGIGGA